MLENALMGASNRLSFGSWNVLISQMKGNS